MTTKANGKTKRNKLPVTVLSGFLGAGNAAQSHSSQSRRQIGWASFSDPFHEWKTIEDMEEESAVA